MLAIRMDCLCGEEFIRRRLSFLYYTKSTSKAGGRFIEAGEPRRGRRGSGCRERGFLDAGNFSGVKFHECKTLSAEVLERRADEIDVLVVDDEEPVVKGLVVPHGKLRVLGVEGRNVGRGFPSGPEAAICDFKPANSNALNWNMNPDGDLSMLRLTCTPTCLPRIQQTKVS